MSINMPGTEGKRFTGRLDPTVLADELYALRLFQQMNAQPEAFTSQGVPKKGGSAPYALAGLAGRKRTPRTKKWTPTPRYVSADSTENRRADQQMMAGVES